MCSDVSVLLGVIVNVVKGNGVLGVCIRVLIVLIVSVVGRCSRV